MSGASQSHMLEWFDLKKRALLQLKEAEAHQGTLIILLHQLPPHEQEAAGPILHRMQPH
jgi:hypothetical protein